ncbi:NAD(P)-dependent oxidoreductase [Saccharibacillus sp. JS10]|uniref:NAD-dependent epimerase/dehydratase family protein n=1 Tax=Saccharibacillus sp. JS10 TaxID=2950552 RepID=UPI00210BC88E|nr:NAD-dependent epimerase/dehydratase family protein [Saccharibacillus sp. JS10]MCQ4087813.1 NAD-dependent epimerase/dehydratase family protein [Saccharibacillus sp. JS10]
MKLKNKNVLVTGVSGTLGDKIATKFLAEGAQVKGLIRSEQQTFICENLHIEPVISDLNDSEKLKQALQDVQIVIHAAAYLSDDPKLAEEANIRGMQTLVDAAISAGVERFVHISTLSAYDHLKGGSEVDESRELAVGHFDVYVSTKSESERILRQAEAQGLEIVILRPGLISSEHNSHWGDRLVKKLADTDHVDWIHPEDIAPWVHAENVAEMCVLAATHSKAAGQAYNAVDGNYPEQQFSIRILEALNKSFTIPGGDPIKTVYSHNKIVEELGYRPIRTFEETVALLEEQARVLISESS